MAKTTKKTVPFEDQLARIEAIVTELERPAIPLDQAISLYEEGVGLIKNCQQLLTEAEQKVHILGESKQ